MASRKGSLKATTRANMDIVPSHHPLLAVLSEYALPVRLAVRSGNCGTSRGVEEFLKKLPALWGTARKDPACYGPIQASSTTSC